MLDHLPRKATVERDGAMVTRFSKMTWGKKYYSYDGGRSWNQSGAEAYRTAKDSGLLNAIETVERYLVIS